MARASYSDFTSLTLDSGFIAHKALILRLNYVAQWVLVLAPALQYGRPPPSSLPLHLRSAGGGRPPPLSPASLDDSGVSGTTLAPGRRADMSLRGLAVGRSRQQAGCFCPGTGLQQPAGVCALNPPSPLLASCISAGAGLRSVRQAGCICAGLCSVRQVGCSVDIALRLVATAWSEFGRRWWLVAVATAAGVRPLHVCVPGFQQDVTAPLRTCCFSARLAHSWEGWGKWCEMTSLWVARSHAGLGSVTRRAVFREFPESVQCVGRSLRVGLSRVRAWDRVTNTRI